MPGRVGQEVVQHLHDAPPVGHHRRQVRGEVDRDVLPRAAAHEGAARPVHQDGHLGGLGRDREPPRLHAPEIEQVADQGAHLVGLVDDDAQERAHLRPIERLGGLVHGDR